MCGGDCTVQYYLVYLSSLQKSSLASQSTVHVQLYAGQMVQYPWEGPASSSEETPSGPPDTLGAPAGLILALLFGKFIQPLEAHHRLA